MELRHDLVNAKLKLEILYKLVIEDPSNSQVLHDLISLLDEQKVLMKEHL